MKDYERRNTEREGAPPPGTSASAQRLYVESTPDQASTNQDVDNSSYQADTATQRNPPGLLSSLYVGRAPGARDNPPPPPGHLLQLARFGWEKAADMNASFFADALAAAALQRGAEAPVYQSGGGSSFNPYTHSTLSPVARDLPNVVETTAPALTQIQADLRPPEPGSGWSEARPNQWVA